MSKWEKVKLGDCFTLSSGKFLPTKNRVEGEYNVYGGNGITGKHNEYFIDDPTVVIGRVGEYCGSVHMTGEKVWVTDNALYVTKFLKTIDTNYICYALNDKNLNRYANKSGQPSISQSAIFNIEIALPPIETQKKISGILDTIVELLAMRKLQLVELDNLIKTIFYDMFGNPMVNEKGWEMHTFKDVATIDTKMTKDFEKYADSPHIGIESIEKGTGNILDYKLVKNCDLISGKYLFSDKHIIYSKIRPNLNKVALPFFNGICSADAYPILPNEDNSDKYYLAYILRSDFFLNYILDFSGRTNIPKVNKQQLEGFQLPLPPIELQNKFANIVNKIEEQKALVKKAIEETQHLFDSLMSEYFE
ncbi:hypothetical protein BSK64_15595 [Paenibacillus odorifer]|uniref:restriction endonuclease subunit S n=1 Tax=Paenibacillus odorifer TaxID=189426 RepID=UPI00096CF81C|nr:restriction endonuclease subunit S [Paenibacillus odorifer]OME04667.1 hypothetical protein BSK64_15595 [Paenibacillus odorifer]